SFAQAHRSGLVAEDDGADSAATAVAVARAAYRDSRAERQHPVIAVEASAVRRQAARSRPAGRPAASASVVRPPLAGARRDAAWTGRAGARSRRRRADSTPRDLR